MEYSIWPQISTIPEEISDLSDRHEKIKSKLEAMKALHWFKRGGIDGIRRDNPPKEYEQFADRYTQIAIRELHKEIRAKAIAIATAAANNPAS